MAHKTMVDGTAYEIKGGRTLVDGTAYDVKKGKTLVGGTAYDIGFSKTQTVIASGDSFGSHSQQSSRKLHSLSINGESITSTGTYSYETDGILTIIVTVNGDPNASIVAGVWLNSEKVLSGYGSYTLNTEAAQILIDFSTNGILIRGTRYTGGKAEITTA